MSRILFNHPFMLGFDSVGQSLERISKHSDNYPPYNIEQHLDDLIIIRIAVAGFEKEDLSVYQENKELIICGERTNKDKEIIYLHQGISFRKFQKVFVLAEEIVPVSSNLEKGILSIVLEKQVVQKDIKIIDIKEENLIK